MPSMQKWTLNLIWLIYLLKCFESRWKIWEIESCSRCSHQRHKKSFLVNTLEEELVLLDYFCFEAPETFVTNREKIINVSSDREWDTNSDFFKSPTTNLSIENLKTISNKQMLTDNVINVLQKMFKMLPKYLY